MNPQLSPRLLALPPDVRATLAGVEGPGWQALSRGVAVPFTSYANVPHNFGPPAWFPANPAAAVAAVLGVDLWEAHFSLSGEMDYADTDDHAAALSIIEAHVASRSPA